MSISRRQGDGRVHHFCNIRTKDFILFPKLVPDEGKKEYLRVLDEFAKGRTCCEQQEIDKRA